MKKSNNNAPSYRTFEIGYIVGLLCQIMSFANSSLQSSSSSFGAFRFDVHWRSNGEINYSRAFVATCKFSAVRWWNLCLTYCHQSSFAILQIYWSKPLWNVTSPLNWWHHHSWEFFPNRKYSRPPNIFKLIRNWYHWLASRWQFWATTVHNSDFIILLMARYRFPTPPISNPAPTWCRPASHSVDRTIKW